MCVDHVPNMLNPNSSSIPKILPDRLNVQALDKSIRRDPSYLNQSTPVGGTASASVVGSSAVHSNIESMERLICGNVIRTNIHSVKVREGSVDLEPDVPYLYEWPHFTSPLDVFDDEDLLPTGFFIVAQYGPKPLLDMLGRLQQPMMGTPRSSESSHLSLDDEGRDDEVNSAHTTGGESRIDDVPDVIGRPYSEEGRVSHRSVIFRTAIERTDDGSVESFVSPDTTTSTSLFTLLPEPSGSPDGLRRAIEISANNDTSSLTSFRRSVGTSRAMASSPKTSSRWLMSDDDTPQDDVHWRPSIDEVEIEATGMIDTLFDLFVPSMLSCSHFYNSLGLAWK